MYMFIACCCLEQDQQNANQVFYQDRKDAVHTDQQTGMLIIRTVNGNSY